MSDYISREERESAIEYLSNISSYYIDYSDQLPEPLPEYFAIETAIKMLSADVRENIRGTWEEWKGKVYANVPICSNCKHGFPLIAKEYNFCPHCGADMRGET